MEKARQNISKNFWQWLLSGLNPAVCEVAFNSCGISFFPQNSAALEDLSPPVKMRGITIFVLSPLFAKRQEAALTATVLFSLHPPVLYSGTSIT